jgi:hypothetical protein
MVIRVNPYTILIARIVEHYHRALQTLENIPAGFATVPAEKGNNGVCFHKPPAGFDPGYVFLRE